MCALGTQRVLASLAVAALLFDAPGCVGIHSDSEALKALGQVLDLTTGPANGGSR
jgi:hypothetical protein